MPMLKIGDLEELSEDEEFEQELKSDRIDAAERAFQRRWNYLRGLRSLNLRRVRRRKNRAAKRKAVQA